MSESDDLFELIHAMDKNEKRYFRMVSSMQSGEKSYINIFDGIRKMKSFEKEEFHKIFRKETAVKNSSASKAHLTQLLLKSLRWFHSGRSVEFDLMNRHQDFRILFEKGLFRHCSRVLKKAKHIAEEKERFSDQVRLIRCESDLASQWIFSNNILDDASRLNERESRILEHLQREVEYRKLSDEMYALTTISGVGRTKKGMKRIREILKHPFVEYEKNANTFGCKVLRIHIHSAWCYFMNKPEEHSVHQRQLIALIESNPVYMDTNPYSYVAMLHNYLISSRREKNYGEFFSTLSKLRSITTYSAFLKAKIFETSYSFELEMYASVGDFVKGMALENAVESGLKKHSKSLHRLHRLGLIHNLVLNFFGAGNYKKALHWIYRLIHDPEIGDEDEIHYYANMVMLIIHAELGNTDLLPGLSGGVRRMLQKKKRYFPLEKIILELTEKKIPEAENKEALYSAYTETLDAVRKILSTPQEKIALEYFDFVSWLESKLEKRSFAEVVRGREEIRK